MLIDRWRFKLGKVAEIPGILSNQRLYVTRFNEYCIWFCLSPIFCILVAIRCCLGCEVFCFSILAYGLYRFSTKRITGFNDDKINQMINWMITFIANGKDHKMRIFSAKLCNV